MYLVIVNKHTEHLCFWQVFLHNSNESELFEAYSSAVVEASGVLIPKYNFAGPIVVTKRDFLVEVCHSKSAYTVLVIAQPFDAPYTVPGSASLAVVPKLRSELAAYLIGVVAQSPRELPAVTGLYFPKKLLFGKVLMDWPVMRVLLVANLKCDEESCQLARLSEHLMQLVMMLTVEVHCVAVGEQVDEWIQTSL